MPEELSAVADLDRTIHEPARLVLVALLAEVKRADFLWLLGSAGLTRGNLSSHMSRLEEARYVEVEKRFVDRKPQTLYRLTDKGRRAWDAYRKTMRHIVG